MDRFSTSLSPMDMGSDLNALQYIIRGCNDNMVNTLLIVRVTGINGDRIDVQTVISDLDNKGKPIGTYLIPSVRYLKWQYGKNAVVGTPEVGDIGLLLVSKQDTSGLTKNGESICQTSAVFNVGDGIYLGGLNGLNENPTQFLEFGTDSVKLTGTGTITIEAPTVEVKATTADIKATTVNVEASGTSTVKGATVNVEATTELNLGGTGGQGVARIGDSVNLQTGKIIGGSSLVLSL